MSSIGEEKAPDVETVLIIEEPIDDRQPLYALCGEHRRQPAWVVCIHILEQRAEPSLCRRLNPQEQAVHGEVLCAACAKTAWVDKAVGRMRERVRIVCEPCVLERFDVSGGS